MSLSPGTKSSKAAKHRHALFSDFLLTMPFGIVNAAAGFISLLFKGGWTAFWILVCGCFLFTSGTMSHQTAVEGAESSWTHTVSSAVVAAVLAQKYYQKAIAGVAGTMVMTIASALVSLGLVYTIVAGGNKPHEASSDTSSNSPAPSVSSPSQTLKDASSKPKTPAFQAQENRTEDTSMQQAEALQPELAELGASPWGINVYTMLCFSGAILYAQGLWGLWGETVGYSPAGMAAAAVSGLVTLGVAATRLQQSSSSQSNAQ